MTIAKIKEYVCCDDFYYKLNIVTIKIKIS